MLSAYAMQRPAKTVREAAQLLQLMDLMSITARTVIDEWSKESTPPIKPSIGNDSERESSDSQTALPSRSLYESQKIMLAAAGMLTELVAEPDSRLVQVTTQYFEARALHIAAERRIPDLLAAAEVTNESRGSGLSAKEIGDAVGIEPLKLCTLANAVINFFSLLLLYGQLMDIIEGSSTATMLMLHSRL